MNSRAVIAGERGSVTFFVIGAFTALLLFLGMSVDFGILFRYRRAMQNACDSGALAGALNLRTDVATAAPTAVRYAENDMQQNNIAWDPARLTATVLPYNAHPDRQIRVEVHSDVPTYFLRLVRDLVHVAVDCQARLTPIILTEGLVPIGLNYNAWSGYYNSDCWQYVTDGVPLDARPPHCQSFDITLNISDASNPWGPGNTGLLSMGCFDCPSGGGAQWRDHFINGAPTAYCYDPNQTSDVTDYSMNGQACANVKTETGVMIGPIRQAVTARCTSGNPMDQIIMMPLLNPQYMASGQGTYTTEIWGFVAFQIDCANTRFTGATPTIRGGFVSIVSMQAYGTETEFETGVWTVRLVPVQ